MNEYVRADSWEAYGKKYAFKHCDKTFFNDRGSRIPVAIRYFFEAESIDMNQKKGLLLKYEDLLFEAHIVLYKNERVQISWNSDLGNKFNKIYEQKGFFPIARFDRLPNTKESMLFSVTFIDELEIEYEEKEDSKLISQVNKGIFKNSDDYTYSGIPKKKMCPVLKNGVLIYPRDPEVAKRALVLAENLCEIDPTHNTFIRRSTNKPYTEPHHLVPISNYNKFDVSLDIEENIVSLCSNCHNQIHYGKDAALLIRQLYKKRKHKLESVGIFIDEENLLKMYANL